MRSIVSRLHYGIIWLLISLGVGWASPSTETVEQALCRLIEGSARSHAIPIEFLTRLIWQESSFRAKVTSPAGAKGIAQFMPGTARERGLQDPFDPEQAIPEAARFVSELTARFGNLGLAAAAYNGGPARVSGWVASQRNLAPETRRYVRAITGRSVEEWLAQLQGDDPERDADSGKRTLSCLQVTALLRRPGRDAPTDTPFAPWGVQLSGNFSKERALRSFVRASQRYAAALGEIHPMVIGTRLRHRGTRTFYRVRIPSASRQMAVKLCDRIRNLGGSCVPLPS